MTEEYNLSVKHIIDAEKAIDHIEIDRNDLSEAMRKQASLYSYYAQQAASAALQVRNFELMLEVKESQIDKAIRDRAVSAGEKVTEGSIKQELARHPRIMEIKRALNETIHIEDICKGLLESLKQRSAMLIQLGSSERQEKQGEMRMKGPEDALDRWKKQHTERGDYV